MSFAVRCELTLGRASAPAARVDAADGIAPTVGDLLEGNRPDPTLRSTMRRFVLRQHDKLGGRHLLCLDFGCTDYRRPLLRLR